ncbi:MAG: SDR family oxidoreductase [Chloroflexi bacterium]|nr:SDR family oxidoreductase [Chloroflexota bacterium]
MTQIALITGANRGIGYQVCKQLAARGLEVILTSRDEKRGRAAVAELEGEGYSVAYHQLDVSDETSIQALLEWIMQTYRRLDMLVNNAGVYPDEGVSVFNVEAETVRSAFEINTLGPFMMCQALVPLMRQHNYGRVVNVSSGGGAICEGMGSYTFAYKMSKVGLNALTRVVASEVRGYNIKVNAMCPGWVRTEMGGPSAPRSVEQGADTAVWLATLPDDGPTDGFFRDRQPIAW